MLVFFFYEFRDIYCVKDTVKDTCWANKMPSVKRKLAQFHKDNAKVAKTNVSLLKYMERKESTER